MGPMGPYASLTKDPWDPFFFFLSLSSTFFPCSMKLELITMVEDFAHSLIHLEGVRVKWNFSLSLESLKEHDSSL
jgi:hypothetical protein